MLLTISIQAAHMNMVPRDIYAEASKILGVKREVITALSFKKVENHHLIEDLVYKWDTRVTEISRKKLEDQLDSHNKAK